MQHNYKRTFDAVAIPHARNEHIKETLSSRINEIQNIDKENTNMDIKLLKNKKSRFVLIAAIIALSFIVIVGFAYANQIIGLLTGGYIEIGKDFVSITTYDDNIPYEVREGKIYFILNNLNKDITGYCSDETYFEYEWFGENGWRHVVVVGGTHDNPGWMEAIWDENGNKVATSSMHNGDETPMWLINSRTNLDLLPPWGLEE